MLCRINWGEFYYIVRRRAGKSRAGEALLLLEQLPVEIHSVDDQLVKEAAEIKADYPVAYADAFCIAAARRVKGKIITSDPEFKAVLATAQARGFPPKVLPCSPGRRTPRTSVLERTAEIG